MSSKEAVKSLEATCNNTDSNNHMEHNAYTSRLPEK